MYMYIGKANANRLVFFLTSSPIYQLSNYAAPSPVLWRLVRL